MDIHEEWRVIADATNYAISNLGRVKRIKADWQGKYLGKVLAGSRHRGGYIAYVLCTPKGKLTKKAHRLVCEAFNGPPPADKPCCAHRDGNPANNTPDNVYWATYTENASDRERHGRTARGENSGARLHPEKWVKGDDHWTRRNPERVSRGENHYAKLSPERVPRGQLRPQSKLKEDQVLEIINAPRVHGSGRVLAEKFGVSMGLISAIRSGRAWNHISADS
ncbi:MAG: NUMOD4 motif-containing HNH endonuclease [Gammaproteobacteria bacterium]|nr:NUMOD4 motif-containing HNH endonuclease [Gammaproteobacteria bacterium]